MKLKNFDEIEFNEAFMSNIFCLFVFKWIWYTDCVYLENKYFDVFGSRLQVRWYPNGRINRDSRFHDIHHRIL